MESARRNGLATYFNFAVVTLGFVVEVIRYLGDQGIEAHSITLVAGVASILITYLKKGQAVAEIEAQGFYPAEKMMNDALTEDVYYEEPPAIPTDVQATR